MLSKIFLTLLLSWSLPLQEAIGAPLEQIQARGKLIVAVKDNLPPLGFINDQGELVGLEIDLARGLAEELLGDPNAVIFVPVSNQDRLHLVLEDEVDLVIANLGANASRRRLVDFSPHYYLSGTAVVTKSGGGTLEKVAVLQYSGAIALMGSLFPQAQLVPVESYQEAMELMEKDQVDGFAADQTVLTGWVQEYPQYRLLTTYLSSQPLGVAMPKGLQYQELRHQVQQIITAWQESGWLRQRADHWGLP